MLLKSVKLAINDLHPSDAQIIPTVKTDPATTNKNHNIHNIAIGTIAIKLEKQKNIENIKPIIDKVRNVVEKISIGFFLSFFTLIFLAFLPSCFALASNRSTVF